MSGFGNPFYGPIAYGTSARSEVLTDWPAGGFVGIHGTNEPQLIPGRISHGCIRMRNADILRLSRLMPVGTPLVIRQGAAVPSLDGPLRPAIRPFRGLDDWPAFA